MENNDIIIDTINKIIVSEERVINHLNMTIKYYVKNGYSNNNFGFYTWLSDMENY